MSEIRVCEVGKKYLLVRKDGVIYIAECVKEVAGSYYFKANSDYSFPVRKNRIPSAWNISELTELLKVLV